MNETPYNNKKSHDFASIMRCFRDIATTNMQQAANLHFIFNFVNNL